MKSQRKNHLRRLLGITAVTAIAAFVAIGGFLIHAADKKRAFDGRLSIQVCKKLPNGQWQEIDKVSAPINFEASLIEAASGKIFNSNYNWSGTSEKGARFDSRLGGAGKVTADLTTGRFDITSLPLKLNLNGKLVSLNLPLTTESVNAPNGTNMSGKRARIVNRQGDIALVGFSVPVVINHEEQIVGGKKIVGQKKEELIFIARAEGKIAAK